MSNGVRAGTAYIDIKIGSIEKFKERLQAEVKKAGEEAAAKLATEMGNKVSAVPVARSFATQFGDAFAREMNRPLTRVASNLISWWDEQGGNSVAKFAKSFATGMIQEHRNGSFKKWLNDLKTLGGQAANALASPIANGISRMASNFRQFGSELKGSVAAGLSVVGAKISAMPAAIERLGGKLTQLGQRIGFLGFQLQNMGFLMATAFTAPLVGLGILATVIGVKTAAKIETATNSLKHMLPVGYDVEALVKRLQVLAQKSPVFDSTDVLVYTQQLVAAGIQINKVEKFMQALSNVFIHNGGDITQAKSALLAFSQMASKGVVSMQELKLQLGNALPGALQVAAKGMGVTQKKLIEMVESGEVSADQMIDAFIKVGNSKEYLDAATDSVDTLAGRWQQFKEAVQTKLGNAFKDNSDKLKSAMDKLQPTVEKLVDKFVDDLPGALNKLDDFINKLKDLKDKYDNLDPRVKKFAKRLAEIAIVAGPIAVIVGGIATVVGTLSGVLGAIATPVGGYVLAVLGAAAATYGLYKWFKHLYETSPGFKKFVDGVKNAIKSMGPYFKEEWQKVVDAFNDAKKQIKDALGDNEEALRAFKAIFQGIIWSIAGGIAVVIGLVIGLAVGIIRILASIIKGVGEFVAGFIQLFNGIIEFWEGVFTGNWKKMGKGLEDEWKGLWKIVKGVWDMTIGAIISGVEGFIDAIVKWFEHLYDKLVGHSIIPDLVNAIKGWWDKLTKWTSGMVSGLKDIWNRFKGDLESLKKSASDKISSLIDTIKGIPGKIKSNLGNLGSLLWSSGRDVVSGLISGIDSMTGGLISKAKHVAGKVQETFQHALQIKSPSRVMHKIGEYVSLGLSNGMSAGIPDVVRSASAVAMAAVKPFSFAASIGVSPSEIPKSKASLYIENYVAPEKADPFGQAEAWAWLNNTRGY